MAKHSFKMGGSGKTVVVVPMVDSDVGEASTVTIDAVAGEVVSDERLIGGEVVRDPIGLLEGLPSTSVPQGWDFAGGETDQVADMGTGGTVILSDVGTVVASLACEPDVVNVLQALRADDDGMGIMEAVESSVITSDRQLDAVLADMAASVAGVAPMILVDDVDVTDAAIEVVASEPVVSPFAALVAAHKPVVADCVVSVALPAMLTIDARAMALRIADLTGVAVTVTGPNGAESIVPRSRGAKAARVPVASDGGERSTVVRLTPGLTVAGDWLTYDARLVCKLDGGNASNIKTWERIRDAGARFDLDSLRAMDFAGARDDTSGNTYTKNNGRFLRAMIGKVEAAQAAMDAEFGIKLAAD